MAQRPSVRLGAGARSATVAAVLSLAGCGHTEPFTSPPYGSDAPFDATPPARLTYNAAADRTPAWLADGAGLLYSTQQTDRLDDDVCAAVLPPAGGTQRELWCDVPGGPGATDAVEAPVIGADERLGFLTATGTVGATNPLRSGIAVASSFDPRSGRMVRTFPYTPEGGTLQFTADHLRWLDAGRLVYVGQNLRVGSQCQSCPTDTLRTGEAVTILDVNAAESLPVILSGTTDATGVAVEPGGGAVLYTLAGDSRVYRHDLSSGLVQVAHDFGAAGIARDVHLVGNRMAAVVGGRVAFGSDPVLGPIQYDSGGVVQLVDLAAGTVVALDATGLLYRRPAISPGGGAIAAEGFPLIITSLRPGVADTTVSPSGDIYLFGAP